MVVVVSETELREGWAAMLMVGFEGWYPPFYQACPKWVPDAVVIFWKEESIGTSLEVAQELPEALRLRTVPGRDCEQSVASAIVRIARRHWF